MLAALPNGDDGLTPIYGQVRSAIVEAFNSEDLTPVRGGGAFRSARSLVRSPSEFRAGLDENDLGSCSDSRSTGHRTSLAGSWTAMGGLGGFCATSTP